MKLGQKPMNAAKFLQHVNAHLTGTLFVSVLHSIVSIQFNSMHGVGRKVDIFEIHKFINQEGQLLSNCLT